MNTTWNDGVKEISREIKGELIELRRGFHANPEMGFQEFDTAAKVAAFLSQRGIAHRTGVAKTGVLATIRGSGEGPAVLLRADMDCLPIQEANDVPYRSRRDGLMHACGHDGHVAILLGVADVLHRMRDRLKGTVRLAFQPAEEGLGGAEPLIAEGALDDPPCGAAFGLHVWNSLPAGTIGLREGPAMAAVDEFTARVVGRGGHGAEPMDTADPVIAAAHIVTALQTIVSRNLDAIDAGVVTVAAIHGGHAHNVIPDAVELRGTLRSFNPETRVLLRDRVKEIAESVARALGTRADVDLRLVYPATVNDPAMTRLAWNVAAKVVGENHLTPAKPVMGGEDFSYFLNRVPGAYIFLGSNNADRGLVQPHHSPRFDFDESCLPIGVELLSSVAFRYVEENTP